MASYDQIVEEALVDDFQVERIEESNCGGNNNEYYDDELKCTVCTEIFKDPKFLECIHTFCADCIKRLSAENDDTVRCPICNQVHQLKKEDVDSLLTNYVIRNKIEIKSKEKDYPICHNCVFQKRATNYCKDGCMNMCTQCTKHHKSSVRTCRHKFVEISEAPGKGMISGVSYCQAHDEILKYFCEKCNILVCSDCERSDLHREHKTEIILAKDLQERKKKDILTNITLADEINKILEPHIESGNNFLKEVEESDNNSIQLIEKIFDAAKEELNKRKDAIIQQIHDKSNTKSFSTFHEAAKNLNELSNFVKLIVNDEKFDNMEVLPAVSSKLQASLAKIGSQNIILNKTTAIAVPVYQDSPSPNSYVQSNNHILKYDGHHQFTSNISDTKPVNMNKRDCIEPPANIIPEVIASNFKFE